MTETPRPTAESLLAEALHKPGVLGVHDGAFEDASCGLCREKAATALTASPDLAAALSDSALREALAAVVGHVEDAADDVNDPCMVQARALLAQPTPDDKPSLDAITAWLQSPEAESRLAEALHDAGWTTGHDQHVPNAKAILAALTKP